MAGSLFGVLMGLPRDLRGFTRSVHAIIRRIDLMAIDITDIKAALASAVSKTEQNTSTLGSIKTLLEGIRATVTTLDARVVELQAQIENDEDVTPEDLQGLRDGLGVLGTKLDEQATAEAVILNTPPA